MVGGRRLCWQLPLLPEWNRTKEGGGMELGSGPLMECTLQPMEYIATTREKCLLKKVSANLKAVQQKCPLSHGKGRHRNEAE